MDPVSRAAMLASQIAAAGGHGVDPKSMRAAFEALKAESAKRNAEGLAKITAQADKVREAYSKPLPSLLDLGPLPRGL